MFGEGEDSAELANNSHIGEPNFRPAAQALRTESFIQ